MLIGNMSTESLMIAVSGIVIVFIMLAVLSIIIVAISRAVGSIAGSMSAAPAAAAAVAPRPAPAPVSVPVAAPVQLSGVNDLTAACIMAIVSDELGVTPDQLVFKSIRAL